MNIKPILETTINNTTFDLSSMLERIDIYFAEGKLGTNERQMLIDLAKDKVKVDVEATNEIPRLWSEIVSIKERLNALESLESENNNKNEEINDGEYEDWHTPTGVHDAYFNGMKMHYTDGINYTCVAPEGFAVIWGPDITPNYWRLEERQ